MRVKSDKLKKIAEEGQVLHLAAALYIYMITKCITYQVALILNIMLIWEHIDYNGI